ncbi:MAG: caspase family protein [Proteobacteria bacterium]|nr:caspase family protein [Pseudomonadota bacterium]
MDTSRDWPIEKIARGVVYGLVVAAMLGLCGCATLMAKMIPAQRIKVEDYVACDKNQSPAKHITEDICEQVNDWVHKEAKLPDAVVGFDLTKTGRLQLAGKYKNDDEVEKVFAITQSFVGSDGVSPVKPGYIQVEGWQKCLTEKFAGRQCDDTGEGFELQKKPPGPIRDRYALIIGVGQFQNKSIPPLAFAVKDANSVAAYLTDPQLGGFPSNHVTVLTDAQATSKGITAALADLELRAKPDDLVVVYFSSHGTSPTPHGHVNVVAYDTYEKKADVIDSFLQRQSVWQSSVPQQRLHDFFHRIQSKRVLMVLDVCFSGDVFSQIPGFKPTGSEALATYEQSYASGYSAQQLSGILGGKNLSLEDSVGRPVAAKPMTAPRANAKNRPATLKASGNPAKAWGKVAISASDKDEESNEPNPNVDSSIPNSYFTYYFLDNLKKNRGQIQSSLLSAIPSLDAALQAVTARVSRQAGSGGSAAPRQQPQFFSIPNNDNWNFSVNKNH